MNLISAHTHLPPSRARIAEAGMKGLSSSSSSFSSSNSSLDLPRRRTRTSTRAMLPQQAFTLIELILVLTLLGIATSLVAPSLSNFFRGRALDSEARQLLALTHAGQSRAIAEGFPMLLWINSPGHEYGLEEEASSRGGNSRDTDPKAEEFAFPDQVRIEAVNASPMPVNGRSLPAIRFLPDGTIDESSASTVRLAAASGEALWLIQATNHLSYEIRQSDR